MKFKSHLLLYILLPLCVGAVACPYYRFLVLEDYVVEYEAPCNPSVNQCFIGTDEASSEQYFFARVHKHASDLKKECGVDITDCFLASMCTSTNTDCSVQYCSSDDGPCSFEPSSSQLPATTIPETDAKDAISTPKHQSS